tara:strand:+ start:1385 stop:2221 length:837 start_codon:yes stop_codon:yes gene_type:complete
MGNGFSKIPRSEIFFFLNRITAPLVFIILAFQFDNDLFYSFVILEPLIAIFSLLIYIYVSANLLKNLFIILVFLFFFLSFIMAVFNPIFILISFIIVESFRSACHFFSKRKSIINHNLIISIFELISLVIIIFFNINFKIFLIITSTFRLYSFFSIKKVFFKNSIKRKKSSSIAIIRNIFSVFARNNIISIVTNPIAIISIKIINQITLYSWSFIRSNSNVMRINLKKYLNLIIILLILFVIFAFYFTNSNLKILFYSFSILFFVVLEIYYSNEIHTN